MSSRDVAVVALATRQHGLVAVHQLQALGVSPSLATRRCAAGHWERSAPGVYRIGAAPSTLQQRAMAAHLAAGPGSLVSHRTAARLWGLVGTLAVPIEVSIARGHRHSRTGVITHTSGDLDSAGATHLEGIPVTGLARTLLDLGAVEPWRVRSAVWAARRAHGLGWDELLRTLVSHAQRGRSGVGPLRRVLAAHYGEAAGDSATEDLAYALLVDSGRVPMPVRQHPIRCADGVVIRADLAWPARRALVEIDGVDHFTNEDVQQTDRHRRNQIELAGWTVLVYSGLLLRTQPDQFILDCERLLNL